MCGSCRYALDCRSSGERELLGRFALSRRTKRLAIDAYLRLTEPKPSQLLFAGRGDGPRGLTTRQYARLVQEWVASIGPNAMRQTADVVGDVLRVADRGGSKSAIGMNPPSLLTVKIAAQPAACGTSKMSVASPTSAWRAPALVSASGTPPSDTATTSGPGRALLSSLRILTWAMKASMLPSSHASERSSVHEGHPRIRVWRPLGPQA